MLEKLDFDSLACEVIKGHRGAIIAVPMEDRFVVAITDSRVGGEEVAGRSGANSNVLLSAC
jgi:hypothetical protein